MGLVRFMDLPLGCVGNPAGREGRRPRTCVPAGLSMCTGWTVNGEDGHETFWERHGASKIARPGTARAWATLLQELTAGGQRLAGMRVEAYMRRKLEDAQGDSGRTNRGSDRCLSWRTGRKATMTDAQLGLPPSCPVNADALFLIPFVHIGYGAGIRRLPGCCGRHCWRRQGRGTYHLTAVTGYQAAWFSGILAGVVNGTARSPGRLKGIQRALPAFEGRSDGRAAVCEQ